MEKKGEKRTFLLYLGEKYDFRKKGRAGKNFNYFDNLYPCIKIVLK